MNIHYKFFTIFTMLLVILFSSNLYMITVDTHNSKNLSIQSEAKSLTHFMLAFRSVYQDIFIQKHIEITEENINFLPLKTTPIITNKFSELNMETKVHTVSDRPRNLKNKANSRQMDTINFFKKNPNTQSLLKELNNTYYYAQALNISTTCLNCHGKRADAPKYIREKYALAYDYKLGELRGIIEIEMKETRVTQKLDKDYLNNIIFLSTFFALSIIIAFMYASNSRRLAKTIRDKEDKIYIQELKQKEYLDTVIESSNNAIITINEKLDILTYNKKAKAVFGYTKEEMLDKGSIFKIIPYKYHKIFEKEIRAYFERGSLEEKSSEALEFRALRKDTSMFPIQVFLGMNTQGDKNILIVNIADLSIEKELQQISQKIQKELEKSLERFDENVLASKTDLKGNIIYASQALCAVSGYSQKELMGANHNIFQHEEMPPILFEELWRSIASKKTWKGEIKNRKKDGNYFWVYTSIIPTLDSKNKIIAYDAISQDITEKKIKEEFSNPHINPTTKTLS